MRSLDELRKSEDDGLRFEGIAEANFFLAFLGGFFDHLVFTRFFADADQVAFPLEKLAEGAAEDFALVREVAIPHVGFQGESEKPPETGFDLRGFMFFRGFFVFIWLVHA